MFYNKIKILLNKRTKNVNIVFILFQTRKHFFLPFLSIFKYMFNLNLFIVIKCIFDF